ncbi:MAG TPA: hypothetical protein VHD62_12370 [Opitutaceae bacterium]|nr:hypothetical protein [Opitutaceae bacterium]
MKNLLKLSLLAAGLAVVSVPAFGADSAPAARARHPVMRALLKQHAVRQHIAKKLDLSADQVSQLKAKRAGTAAALKSIRADANLTPEQKKAKARETLQAARNDLKSVLTADQQAKLQQMRKNLRARLDKKN